MSDDDAKGRGGTHDREGGDPGSDVDSDSDSDSEFDYLLDESEDPTAGLRRLELEGLASRRLLAASHGYGGFLHARAGSLPDLSPGCAVVHCYVDCDACARLDVEMEGVCGGWMGTRWLRVEGAGVAGKGKPLDVKKEDLPCLVVVRDGAVVNKSVGLRDFGGVKGLQFGIVEGWLEKAGLDKATDLQVEKLCGFGAALREDDGDDGDGGDVDGADECYDCGLEGCNKNFPHQHIGAGIGAMVNEEVGDYRV